MGENEKLVAFATKVESLEVEKEQLESEISRLREEIGNLEPAYGEMRAELAAMKHHAVELANERDSLLAKVSSHLYFLVVKLRALSSSKYLVPWLERRTNKREAGIAGGTMLN